VSKKSQHLLDYLKLLTGMMASTGAPPDFHVGIYNAQRLASAALARGLPFLYWEGYAYNHIPCHHAWITINGKVIDLTWRASTPAPGGGEWADAYALGAMPNSAAYVGVCIDVSDSFDRMVEHEVCYSYLDDHANGHKLLRHDSWVDYEAPKW